MQIVAVQIETEWENKEANHARVQRLLAQADVVAGSLIVLPEMFDTGFSMNLDVTAQCEERRSEACLKEIAAQYASTVLGGVVGPICNGLASNEAVAFAPNGELLVRYKKRQPFTLMREETKYGRGAEGATFEWNGISVAPFICYDLRFPELFRPAAVSGVELFLVIACWPAVRSEHWVRLLQARAIENLAIAVGVNRCGGSRIYPLMVAVAHSTTLGGRSSRLGRLKVSSKSILMSQHFGPGGESFRLWPMPISRKHPARMSSVDSVAAAE